MHHIISFSEIPEHGIHLEIKDMSWFPEELVRSTGTAAAKLLLAKKGENKVEVRGTLTAEIILACDRCLEEFTYTIESPIQLILEVSDPEHHWRIQDLQGSEADVDTVLLDAPRINIGDLLREQIYLAVPPKHLCGQACRGLCPQCGANLNKGNCACTRNVQNSPFAVLGTLKKNK